MKTTLFTRLTGIGLNSKTIESTLKLHRQYTYEAKSFRIVRYTRLVEML
jgi:hypothetical protein